MKKRVLILFGISIAACITILIIISNLDNHKSNKNDNNNVFSMVDLKTVDDLIIGSELPKVLFSDKEKVIFDCRGGVYIYNMKKKILTQSFDISSFMSGKYSKDLLNCFVTKDGKQLFFGFFNLSKRELIAAYIYSFENNLVKELTEKEYTDYLKKAFICTYLDYNDKLYQKCHGTIASISDNEYVYLTFKYHKVSTINIVYVSKGNETHYRVFDKN